MGDFWTVFVTDVQGLQTKGQDLLNDFMKWFWIISLKYRWEIVGKEITLRSGMIVMLMDHNYLCSRTRWMEFIHLMIEKFGVNIVYDTDLEIWCKYSTVDDTDLEIWFKYRWHWSR